MSHFRFASKYNSNETETPKHMESQIQLARRSALASVGVNTTKATVMKTVAIKDRKKRVVGVLFCMMEKRPGFFNRLSGDLMDGEAFFCDSQTFLRGRV